LLFEKKFFIKAGVFFLLCNPIINGLSTRCKMLQHKDCLKKQNP